MQCWKLSSLSNVIASSQYDVQKYWHLISINIFAMATALSLLHTSLLYSDKGFAIHSLILMTTSKLVDKPNELTKNSRTVFMLFASKNKINGKLYFLVRNAHSGGKHSTGNFQPVYALQAIFNHINLSYVYMRKNCKWLSGSQMTMHRIVLTILTLTLHNQKMGTGRNCLKAFSG